MKKQSLLLVTVLFAFGTTSTVFAQEPKTSTPSATSTTQSSTTSTSATPTSGFRAEFLTQISDFERKYVNLAESIPAEKYSWRPGEGVRSIGAVFMHVAGANFGLPQRIGTPPPADFKPRGFDTSITEKAKVVETLKRSFAHLRQAAMNVSDADSDKAADWFTGKTTYRNIFLFMTRHLGEHLGQSIAYARINNIVPPWTEEQQQRQRAQQPATPRPSN